MRLEYIRISAFSEDSRANRAPFMPSSPKANHGLEECIGRALNKIKRPSTAEEITELLNRDLGPGDRPFQAKEVAAWLREARGTILHLYWLGSRPRR